MSSRQHIGVSVLLVVIILVFGFVNRPGANNKEMIVWSENDLTWSDFELVRHMEHDYVATIYSTFSCPNLITSEKSRVFAYMNPNLSKKLRGEYDSENVLIHEQYHFHITEYCTRLLRKEIVQRGLGGLSFKVMKDLKTKYSKKLDSLQNVYDSITDHNGDWEKQKYWEMKIDDWLRETAYYENDNIYSYYDFTKNRTSFYRKIYFTMTQKVLTSFPVGEKKFHRFRHG